MVSMVSFSSPASRKGGGIYTSDAGELFTEDFNTSPLVSPWYDVSTFGQGTNPNDASNTYSYEWVNGESGSPSGSAARRKFAATDVMDLQYEYWISPSFILGDPGTLDHAVYVRLSSAGDYDGPSTGFTFYIEPDDTGQLHIQWRLTDNSWESHSIAGAPSMLSSTPRNIHIHAAMNAVGSSDGILQVWIDGVQYLDVSDAKYRLNSGEQFGQLLIAPDAKETQTSTVSMNIDNFSYSDMFVPEIPGVSAPDTPTNFTTAFNTVNIQDLAWDNNDANNTDNLELEISLTGTGGWSALSDPAGSATSATSSSLTEDTQYFYRLRAVNAFGESSYATANGTTTEVTGPWWVPLNTAPYKANSVFADPNVPDGDGAGTAIDPYSLRGAIYNSVLGAEIIMYGGTYTISNPFYTDSDYREGTNGFGINWTSTDVNNPSGINPKLVTMNAAKPANEGQRVTFRSAIGERAIIDCDGHSEFWLVDNTEYYTLEYFSLINVYIGPQIGRQVQSYYNIVQHVDITMDRGSGVGPNTGGIMQWGDRGDHLTIDDCKIVGPGAGVNINTSCIYVRGSNFTTIENCNLSAAPRVIYGKHPNDTTAITVTAAIRNNIIDGDINTSLNGWDISNNIITGDIILTDNGGTGVNSSTGTDDNSITSNTVLGDIILSRSDNFAQLNNVDNNITFGFDILRFQSAVASTNTSDFNLIEDVINYQESALSLPVWRTVLSQDTNSIAGGPTFVTIPPVVVADYELDVGSLGKGTGRGGADMGAIVANIGAPA